MTEGVPEPEQGRPVEEFTRLTLEGRHFDGARLPVRNLAELSRYEEIVRATAAAAWLDDHPGEDLPAAFRDAFQLTVADVEPGSAVTVLEREEVDDAAAIADFEAYFADARDNVQIGLDAIVSNPTLPTTLPFEPVQEFRDFGTSLRADEVLRLAPTPGAGMAVTVTRTVAVERFKRAYDREITRANTRHTEDGIVAGRLIALNANRKNYTIDTLQHGEVTGKYRDPEMTDRLKAVLGNSQVAPVLRIEGRLRYLGDRLVSFLDVTNVEALEIDGRPWSRRLIELAQLTPGWDEEESAPAISFPAIEAARELVRRLADEDLDPPGIYPLEDGGVQLEWASGEKVTNAEIGPDVHFSLFSVVVDPRSSQDEETANLDQAVTFLLGALR